MTLNSSRIADRIERVQRSLNRVRNKGLDSNTALVLLKLNQLLVIARKLADEIYANSNYLEKRRSRINEDIFSLNQQSYKRVAISVLEEELERAIKLSEEYSYSPFADRLRMIPKDSRIATVFLQGSKIRISFEMNKVAGNYKDYLEAVKEARGAKGKTRGVRPENAQKIYGGGSYPDLASRIWAEKIYGVFKGGKAYRRTWKGNKYEKVDVTATFKGLYESIVHERLSNMKDIAPFWSLLEHGNINMKSFGKGLATPVQKPTHFLSRATNEATILLNEAFQVDTNEAMDSIDNELSVNARLLEWANGIIEQLELIIREVDRGIGVATSQATKLEKEIFRKGMKQLQTAAKKAGYAGSLAVETQAIAERARVKALEMVAGISTGRAELGTYMIGGSNVRIRPRTRKISKNVAKSEQYVIYPLDPNARDRIMKTADQFDKQYKQTMDALRRRR